MKLMVLTLVATLFIGCNQEKTTVSNFESYPDTTTINKNSFYKQRIDLLTSIYNLSTITKGANDSLIIRFWPWEAFELWSNMFEFRLDSNGWKGHHYCSFTFPGQDGKIFHVDGNEKFGDSVFIVKQITPKCGWDKFYDSIKIFQLRSLPTQDSIKNFKRQVIRDGEGLSFEIATKDSYRWIEYSNPGYLKCQECDTIDSLRKMVIRQFGDDYFWPKISVTMVSMHDTKNPRHF